jgi:hypothetical protein
MALAMSGSNTACSSSLTQSELQDILCKRLLKRTVTRWCGGRGWHICCLLCICRRSGLRIVSALQMVEHQVVRH